VKNWYETPHRRSKLGATYHNIQFLNKFERTMMKRKQGEELYDTAVENHRRKYNNKICFLLCLCEYTLYRITTVSAWNFSKPQQYRPELILLQNEPNIRRLNLK